MGVWNFVKNAGKKLVGKGDEVEHEEAINKEIEELGLDAKDVKVSVKGDRVVIKGRAVNQAMREKIILAAGNVDGIAEVDDEIETEETAAEPVFHTVEKGDTLSAVAKKTLGNANRYHEIFEANKPMLTHPDKIYPGQVLRIPQDTAA